MFTKTCESCVGEGKINCPTCNGGGISSCSRCVGTGEGADPKIKELILSMIEATIRAEGNFSMLGTIMLAAHQIARAQTAEDKRRHLIVLNTISDNVDYSSPSRAGAVIAFVQSMRSALKDPT